MIKLREPEHDIKYRIEKLRELKNSPYITYDPILDIETIDRDFLFSDVCQGKETRTKKENRWIPKGAREKRRLS